MMRVILFFAGFAGAIIAMAANSMSNAKKDARTLSEKINEKKSEWDIFINGLSANSHLPDNPIFIDKNAALYIVKKEGANIRSVSLNNKMSRTLSESKYRKLMNELDERIIVYTYSLQSHSNYYKIRDNEMLWIYYS
jgi:hypothetical protein